MNYRIILFHKNIKFILCKLKRNIISLHTCIIIILNISLLLFSGIFPKTIIDIFAFIFTVLFFTIPMSIIYTIFSFIVNKVFIHKYMICKTKEYIENINSIDFQNTPKDVNFYCVKKVPNQEKSEQKKQSKNTFNQKPILTGYSLERFAIECNQYLHIQDLKEREQNNNTN